MRWQALFFLFCAACADPMAHTEVHLPAPDVEAGKVQTATFALG